MSGSSAWGRWGARWQPICSRPAITCACGTALKNPCRLWSGKALKRAGGRAKPSKPASLSPCSPMMRRSGRCCRMTFLLARSDQPSTSTWPRQVHAERVLQYVAAPVFGRPDVAEAHKLNIVAAGEPSAIEHVAPLFEAMGQKTWPLGREPYRANVVKLAGNFMLGCAIEAMAEACAMAQAHDVAPADVLGMLTNSLFSSPVYKGYGALIAEERYEPALFKLVLALKDVRLALAAGEDGRVPMPFASVLRDNLIEALAQGDGDKDFAALARVASRRANLTEWGGPHG